MTLRLGRNDFKLGRNDFKLGRNDFELGRNDLSVIQRGLALRWRHPKGNAAESDLRRPSELRTMEKKTGGVQNPRSGVQDGRKNSYGKPMYVPARLWTLTMMMMVQVGSQ